MTTFEDHDPDDRLEYVFDWTKRMEKDADTIATSTFVVEAGLTADGTSQTSTATQIWLKNGIGGVHKVTNNIVTTGGRTYSRSIEVAVREL